jgi:uncharacterized protein
MDPINPLVDRVAHHIQAKFAGEGSGNDWYHINRVRRLAKQIAIAEGGNQDVTELAALVHDIADWKFHDGDDIVGPREAERLLSEEGAAQEAIEQVVEIVRTISFKGAGVVTAMRTLEGRCKAPQVVDGKNSRDQARSDAGQGFFNI